jgi:hypothetical protein
MKLSTIIKGSVCVLGLVGVGNFFAAPANAGDAAARGAVTIVRPSTSSISVSGELTLPTGNLFTGPLTINVLGGANPGGNDETLAGIAIAPTGVTVVAAGSNPVEEAVAAAITAGASVQDDVALIRAAGGVNGFGGLE